MKRISSIIVALTLLSFAIVGCGGGGGGGSSNPVSSATSYNVAGTVSMPTGSSATITASIHPQVSFTGMKAKLLSTTDTEVVSSVNVDSTGAYAFQGVPAGSNYRVLILSNSGKTLLQRNIDSVSADQSGLTVDSNSTAISVLVQETNFQKNGTDIQNAVTKGTISITSITTAVSDWLTGRSSTDGTNVKLVISKVVGSNQINTIVTTLATSGSTSTTTGTTTNTGTTTTTSTSTSTSTSTGTSTGTNTTTTTGTSTSTGTTTGTNTGTSTTVSYDTTVTADITTDQTWSGKVLIKGAANTTYRAKANVTVNPGTQIYLDPGVSVVFEKNAGLVGDASNHIKVFSSVQTITNMNQTGGQLSWQMLSTNPRTITISYVDFSNILGLSTEIDLKNSPYGSFNVSNCTFKQCKNGTGGTDYNIKTTVSNCSFDSCGWAEDPFSKGRTDQGAIWVGGDLTVNNCQFFGNSIPAATGGTFVTSTLSLSIAQEKDPSTYSFTGCSFDSNCKITIYPLADIVSTKTILFKSCTGTLPIAEVRPTTGITSAQSLFVVKYE